MSEGEGEGEGHGKSFRCKACGGKTRVADSRPGGPGEATIRRRRQCMICHARFSTYEIEIPEGIGFGQLTAAIVMIRQLAEAKTRIDAEFAKLAEAMRSVAGGGGNRL